MALRYGCHLRGSIFEHIGGMDTTPLITGGTEPLVCSNMVKVNRTARGGVGGKDPREVSLRDSHLPTIPCSWPGSSWNDTTVGEQVGMGISQKMPGIGPNPFRT